MAGSCVPIDSDFVPGYVELRGPRGWEIRGSKNTSSPERFDLGQRRPGPGWGVDRDAFPGCPVEMGWGFLVFMWNPGQVPTMGFSVGVHMLLTLRREVHSSTLLVSLLSAF